MFGFRLLLANLRIKIRKTKKIYINLGERYNVRAEMMQDAESEGMVHKKMRGDKPPHRRGVGVGNTPLLRKGSAEPLS